jgi:hypothetical protein
VKLTRIRNSTIVNWTRPARCYLYPAMSLRMRILPAGFIAPCLPTKTVTPTALIAIDNLRERRLRIAASVTWGRS